MNGLLLVSIFVGILYLKWIAVFFLYILEVFGVYIKGIKHPYSIRY